MTLSELSIRRHVFAFMLSALLVLFGAIAYQRMGIDKLPYIEFPVISITTAQRGANPDIIDASITNLIETAVNSVPGIEHIQSTSSPGTSQVVITFNLEKRIDVAFQEVQAKVNQVVRRLPKDADPPDLTDDDWDNGSTDGTLKLARQMCLKHDRLRVLHLDEKGRGRAVKRAWMESQADILSYMDVDLSRD